MKNTSNSLVHIENLDLLLKSRTLVSICWNFLLSRIKNHTSKGSRSETEKVIFLPLWGCIYHLLHTDQPNIAVPREKQRRFFEVSTRHLDVVTIAPRGVLVPRSGFRIQFCPAAIISFRSVARILVAPSSSVPPQVATWIPQSLGGVLDNIIVDKRVNLTKNAYEKSRHAPSIARDTTFGIKIFLAIVYNGFSVQNS